jgi:hypothetical protein
VYHSQNQRAHARSLVQRVSTQLSAARLLVLEADLPAVAFMCQSSALWQVPIPPSSPFLFAFLSGLAFQRCLFLRRDLFRSNAAIANLKPEFSQTAILNRALLLLGSEAGSVGALAVGELRHDKLLC